MTNENRPQELYGVYDHITTTQGKTVIVYLFRDAQEKYTQLIGFIYDEENTDFLVVDTNRYDTKRTSEPCPADAYPGTLILNTPSNEAYQRAAGNPQFKVAMRVFGNWVVDTGIDIWDVVDPQEDIPEPLPDDKL